MGVGVRGRIAAMACVAILAVCSRARPADACSPPWGINERVVYPPDGAENVPLNAQVTLAYRGVVEMLYGDFHVRAVGGLPLELERDSHWTGWRVLFVARPIAQLEPETTYEVLDKLDVPCGLECELPGYHVVSTFTTGTSADVASPSFEGLSSIDSSYWPGMEGDTCGFHTCVDFTLKWAPASDDGPDEWIRYNVYDDSDRLQIALVEGTSVSGQTLCSGSPDFWPLAGSFSGPTGAYHVRAADIAGNEEENSIRKSTVSCASPDVDAGPVASPDAGETRVPDPEGCSCALAEPAGGNSSLPGWTLALGLWLCRRRRRLAPGPQHASSRGGRAC